MRLYKRGKVYWFSLEFEGNAVSEIEHEGRQPRQS